MRKVFRSPYTKEEAWDIWKQWKKDNKELYQNLKSICKKCDTNSKLTINHIDGDKTNNVLENLECFCWECHRHCQSKTISVVYKEKDIPEVKCSISCEWEVKELMERYLWKNKKWVLREGLIEL